MVLISRIEAYDGSIVPILIVLVLFPPSLIAGESDVGDAPATWDVSQAKKSSREIVEIAFHPLRRTLFIRGFLLLRRPLSGEHPLGPVLGHT